jgi:uncharacterized membrane protein
MITLLFLAFLLIPETYAGDPHAMWGYCHDGYDKTSAAGAAVTAYIEGREGETVTTIVGSNHQYLIDAGGFSRWSTGDVVVINIKKGECYADRKIGINAVGAQRIPDLALTCPESSDNAGSYEPYVESTDNFTGNESTNTPETSSVNVSGIRNEEGKGGDYFYLPGLLIVIFILAVFFVYIIFIKKKQLHPAKNETAGNLAEKQARENETEGNLAEKQAAENGTAEDLTGKHPADEPAEKIIKISIPEFTNEEVKVIRALAVSGSKESEISKKLGAGAVYTIEKLKERGIVYADDENSLQLSMEIKPRFIFEYMLEKGHKDIVMTLKKEGRLKQIEITHKVGVSRTTVSRRLTELEEMNVVSRCADGTSNKIELSGWFLNNF